MVELQLDVHSALKGLGPDIHHLSGKRVLISGARGFLGRYVVSALLEANKLLTSPCHIIALDSLVTGSDSRDDWRNLPNLSFFQHDVQHSMENAFFMRQDAPHIDYVLHLAGIASPYWYSKLPLETISVSVDGSRNMLEVAQRFRAKYLVTSSSEVYATAALVPTPEHYVGAVPSMSQRSSYDIGKLMSETLAFIYTEKFGLHTNVVRIFNSFGPGIRESDKRIMPRIASAIRAGRPIHVFRHIGGRMPRRTYTPVANTLLGLLLVGLKGDKGGVYNVGLDTPELTVPELCDRVAQATGLSVPYYVEPPSEVYETEPMRRCPDITKLKALGFLPAVDLDEGIRRFISWTQETYTGAP